MLSPDSGLAIVLALSTNVIRISLYVCFGQKLHPLKIAEKAQNPWVS
jgi:hypothetical protein